MFIEYTNVELFIAAIETACWDIIGKSLGKPIYELLGGWIAPEQTTARNRAATDHETGSDRTVKFAFCLGILSPDESQRKAQEALDAGFSALKTKAGRDWKRDVERIRAMHRQVDGKLDFRLDPNQGWTTDQAIRVGAHLENAGIYLQYMEQPIRTNSHRQLANLTNRLRHPIAPN